MLEPFHPAVLPILTGAVILGVLILAIMVIRRNLETLDSEECPHCGGTGFRKSRRDAEEQ